ncbi:MAG: SusC/RagA family TonB-linked outer membrane protein [Niabella sp.]|nr:SusC/RagA family TonB-linked outer membrane protein [Niabella sp.]
MRLLYLILAGVLLPVSIMAQSVIKKGVVLTPDHNPVKGATIRAVKKQEATISDAYGIFILQGISNDDTLEVSHIGFKTQVLRVGDAKALTIVLETNGQTLEEVTVANTGFQKIKPNEVTGSLTVIDNALYNQQTGYSVLERIKTITNGIAAFPSRVGVGPASDIVVRGISTLTMSIQKPLIILDDFEYQGDLENINPNDVENITVLKDAAASAIWGARAANGVIVITTKKSAFNRRTAIAFNANITVGLQPDLKKIKEISPADLVDLEQFLFDQKYRFADTAMPQNSAFTPVYELLFSRQKGTITAEEADRQLNLLRQHDVRDDFKKLFYRNAVNRQYALSVNGGAQNVSWGLSLGVDQNIGNRSEATDRYTVSFNNIYKPLKKLDVGVSVLYAQTQTNSGAPGYGTIRGANSALPVYTQLVDAHNNPLPLYNKYRSTYIDTLGGGRLLDWHYYPATDYRYNTITQRGRGLSAGINMDYRLTKWLTIKGNYRYQVQDERTANLYAANSFYTRDLVNNYTQLGSAIKYPVPAGDILDESTSNTTAQNLRGQLLVDKRWTQHYLSFIGGAEISDAKTTGRSDRTYGYSADILTYTSVDYANLYPMLMGGSSNIPSGKSFTGTTTRFASFFTNGLYVYKDKYSLSASARRDASNTFGVATNDRWKPLWSAGLAWELSKEKFYCLAAMPYLKLRTSYGYQGNVDPSKVAVMVMAYSGTNSLTSRPYAEIVNFPNPDLRWEQTAILNLALDYRLAGDRISGSIEYYHKAITDLYGEAPVDPTTGTGVTSIAKNMGNAKGHGWDLSVNTVNTKGLLLWNTRFFLNTYKMKVTKYRDVPLLATSIVGSGFTPVNGYSPYSYFAFAWAGLDPQTGDPQGYKEGQVSKDYNYFLNLSAFSSLKYIGSFIPTVTGGLANDLHWKNLSISVSMNYKLGYYVMRSSVDYASLVFQQTGHSDYEKRWRAPGDESHTQVPSFIYPINGQRDAFYKSAEVLAARGDHLRISYINLGYDLKKPEQLKGIRNVRAYVVANNLGILWRADKAVNDPDYDDRSIPPAKSISFGVNLGF